jgi:stigma-specific protein Stig1
MTHHWDEFSKSLAEESVPRRHTLRLLGAALAGALLSPLGVRTVWAAGQDPCKSFCTRYPRSQRFQCLAACRACSGDTSRVCRGGGTFACCGAGTTCCSGHCTDLASDVENCGACGHFCDEPGPYEQAICFDGACVYPCVEGAVECNGICTFVESDVDNCGACGNVCPDWAQRCTDGVCDPCIFPLMLCGGVCVDPTSDRNNCGGCGIQCGDTEACIFGFCESGG